MPSPSMIEQGAETPDASPESYRCSTVLQIVWGLHRRLHGCLYSRESHLDTGTLQLIANSD
jgi:hypothetical protein